MCETGQLAVPAEMRTNEYCAQHCRANDAELEHLGLVLDGNLQGT
jgi:hypothetical protein